MTSYLHWLVARAHRIPPVSVGQGKLTETVALFGNPMQRWG
ncbi:MAG: hypothetical protein M5U28_40930 [Sandaracinaceae bacterium]|nr:hypothetical protein [Sandaracinaceae bacterium]